MGTRRKCNGLVQVDQAILQNTTYSRAVTEHKHHTPLAHTTPQAPGPARVTLGAGYGDGPKHKTSETSETNVRNTKYPKYHTKNGDGPKHKTSETSETNVRNKFKRP